MELITERYKNQITGTLTCFDRMIFSGNLLDLNKPGGMSYFLHENKIRCFDFQKTVAKPLANNMKSRVQNIASHANVEITYLGKKRIRKESYVQKILKKRGYTPGLVCILSCVEGCMRFMPQYIKQKNYTTMIMKPGQCLHYYFYFIDESLGLCHLRVPTWLPCRLQFCMNGHNFLAAEFDRRNISYMMKDNCFTQIDDFEMANELAATSSIEFLKQKLEQYVDFFIPDIEKLFSMNYYWSIMQIELSKDIIFKDQTILPEIYEQLSATAVHTVKVQDIATFLGRGVPKTKLDHCGSNLSRTIEGLRIKHSLGKHSIKMYDKFNQVLRIETTSNDISLFKTRRLIHHNDGTISMGNAAIPKHISSLPLAFSVMQSSNNRYHEFISALEDFSVGRRNLKKATVPKTENNRNYKGINFFNEADESLLRAISSGEFTISGFRNNDLKQKLNQDTGKISRSLKRLRVHGLIKKAGGTYKYHLTKLGREVSSTGIKIKELYVIPRLSFMTQT